jgi:uncharacterized protein YbbC (DUF1343 family)
MSRFAKAFVASALFLTASCASVVAAMSSNFQSYTLDYHTDVDLGLQKALQQLDDSLRAKYSMAGEQTAVGLLDLQSLRLAMLHPDSEFYAASVAKIGILLAYFQLHPTAATNLDSQTRHELGLMIRPSSNEMATKFAQQMGLRPIQQVLDSYHFYDASRGGGLWVGKYYGKGGERIGDPVADHSHAATVRQLLRFYLLLEQGKLVSPAASRTMLEIFGMPEIPAEPDKFVKGLAGRDLQILRKSGSWEDWLHDTAIVRGPGRHYILVALTHHPKGDEYLVDLARAADDLLVSTGNIRKTHRGAFQPAPVKPGVEVLFEKNPELIRGKRVGLITNPSAVDSHLNSIIDRFRAEPDVKLVALYGPEHGVRGNAQAGQVVPFCFDEHFHLPVFSLYGQTEKPPADILTKIDQYMRSFDTQHTGKSPAAGSLNGIEVMVCDLQDVGTRVYTFIATMAYAMQACAEANIPFIVLDRPNPIGGAMEGPVLEYPNYSSFIGLYPIPLCHGMTLGELARLFNEKFLPKKANLTVIPAENCRRAQWFDETSLPWVMPSPNLPSLDSATVYPGQVILEGTNLSEGRGTTRPFEIFGAPWIDGFTLTRKSNDQHLPGAKLREAWFTPTFSKFSGQLCGGCQLHVTDRNAFQPIATTLTILSVVKQLYGEMLEFHAEYFDKVMGTASVREALLRGDPVQRILDRFRPGLAEFANLRAPFLLYP